MTNAKILCFNCTRFITGAVLLIAGMLKFVDITTPIKIYNFSNLMFNNMMYYFVPFEMIFGFWILVGLWPGPTRRLSQGLFFMLACVALAKGISNSNSCGCFGRIGVNPWAVLALDLLLFFALCSWGPGEERRTSDIAVRLKLFFCFSMCVLIGIPLLIVLRKGNLVTNTGAAVTSSEGIKLFDPATWTGKKFPLESYVDIWDRISKGRWLVILVRHDCPSCRDSLPSYDRIARDLMDQSSDLQVAILELPPYATAQNDLLPSDSPCILGKLVSLPNWIIETPATFTLSNGIVSPIEQTNELLIFLHILNKK